ncbi:phosphodiester glycosidase family protein [bacterium SCSIO 12741]|nr:phosphodiester glycosidase family protein [bacterium SCSIO 12741]
MRLLRYFLLFLLPIGVLLGSFREPNQQEYRVSENLFISYEVNPQTEDIRLFWKDDNQKLYRSLGRLKKSLEANNQELVFAMNGGMYQPDGTPQGLFIDRGKQVKQLNRVQEAYGNFYMQPNGVFALTKDGKGIVCQSTDYDQLNNVWYATQSGPMLVIDGQLHPKFNKGSSNVHIRNGVGVLPDGRLLFAMSKRKVNFYDMATYFKQKGCKNALYLDGFVSRTYLPAQNWLQMDGQFGVIIGVVKAE